MNSHQTDPLTVETLASIHDLTAAEWDHFAPAGNPFLNHGFLAALEDSGSTTAETGWTPAHLVFRHQGDICGVAPAYLKSHSFGEYVFDWAWADAWQRYGLPYYPKLLIAVPFSPAIGPRLMLDESRVHPGDAESLHDLIDEATVAAGAHSWHLLFADATDQKRLQSEGRLHRLGCQFHWFNRGYRDFDDFLGQLTSRKRKSIRKERRQQQEHGIRFQHFPGESLPEHVLDAFFIFYQATYLKRGQRPYLNLDFFRRLKQSQPGKLHLIMAVQNDRMIAGALFLKGEDTLYGRYWGCLEEYDHLHFETCYYQGIDLAIALGKRCFDAGAQGEHKLIRGFEPVLTHSWHWVDHPDLASAVARFCQEEAADVRQYADAARQALPYRQGEPDRTE